MGWKGKAIGIALALGVTFVAVTGIRCLSATSARCSLDSLVGGAPVLDVPYAETPPELVDAMIDMADVGPGDHVIDLGTGDGRLVIAAARDHGASGLGVDIDPVLVREAEANARAAGVAGRVAFRTEDLFDTPLGEADILTMFLLPEINLRLRPRILAEMRPGARVVSHAFDMGDWRPDARVRIGGARAYLWVVPATVEGDWRLVREGGPPIALRLDQRFQRFTGIAHGPEGGGYVTDGRIAGRAVVFTADAGGGPRRYAGRIAGARMAGEGWSAERARRSSASRYRRSASEAGPASTRGKPRGSRMVTKNSASLLLGESLPPYRGAMRMAPSRRTSSPLK